MKTIGITGGVGAGKSEVLKHIASRCDCTVIVSDKLAYELESPGHECYESIVSLLGKDILGEDGYIDKTKMSAAIFKDKVLLEKVDDIIHPAVKNHILKTIDRAKKTGSPQFVFVEAALLIENGYGHILDEMWYIRAAEDVRRRRLKESRGYSDEKIDSIMASQMPDEIFMKECRVVIDNNGDLDETCRQIDRALAL